MLKIMKSLELVASPTTETTPDIAFAGSLQAVINATRDRDFALNFAQNDALSAIGEALLSGVKTGYIEMATSTGKTALESLVAEAAFRTGKRVLMIAPTKAIAEQLYGKSDEDPKGLKRFTPLHDLANISSHFGTNTGDSIADIVITTYASFLNDANNHHKKLGEFDVILADECHRSLGTKTSEALRNSFPDAVKLGFSATPDYSVDRRSGEVYDKRLFEFSLLNAIENGKTAPVRSLLYKTDDVLTSNTYRADFTDSELAPLIHSNARNATALELSQAFIKDGRQGVIACIPGEKNLHARLMADLLRSNGFRAEDIGSHTLDSDRKHILDLYESGDIDVLTFTRSLEEGWDSTKASFAINLAPTTSPVRTTQLLGRILRKKDDDLDSIFVDFLDEKNGVANKSQYLAMHALNLEYIDFTRVLGRQDYSKSDWYKKPLLPIEHLSTRLKNRLHGLQGKALSDVTVPQRINPLEQQWKDTLSGEGFQDELEYNDVLPATLIRRVEDAYQIYTDKHGCPPTNTAELLDIMGGVERARIRALGAYGLRIDFDATILNKIENRESHNPFNEFEARTAREALDYVLGTLSTREATIISMRFGLGYIASSEPGSVGYSDILKDDSEPRTLDEIGKVFGVTRDRIRQIESKALSRLRHPSRSMFLRDFLDGNIIETVEPHYDRPANPSKDKVSTDIEMATAFYQKRYESFIATMSTVGKGRMSQIVDRTDIKRIFDFPIVQSYQDDLSSSELIWRKDDPWYKIAVNLRSQIVSGQPAKKLSKEEARVARVLLDKLIAQAT